VIGSIMTINGQPLGDGRGTVRLIVNGSPVALEIVEWSATAAKVRIPAELPAGTQAQIEILRADGSVFIEGFRCGSCGAVFPEATMACRACGHRPPPEAFTARETGKLHSWSVVHRSYPGIAVPFVLAIVDLDDGLTIKGTLRDVAEADLRSGMPVRLMFDDAGGARDPQGAPYVGFHFIPAGGQP